MAFQAAHLSISNCAIHINLINIAIDFLNISCYIINNDFKSVVFQADKQQATYWTAEDHHGYANNHPSFLSGDPR